MTEGLEKARDGKLEVLRETLLALMQARFPHAKLKRQAKGQVAMINDPAVLQGLIVKISLAQNAEEAQNFLLEWPATDDE